MTRRSSPRRSLALRLSAEGQIEQVFMDGLGLAARGAASFDELVSPSSKEKALGFIETVCERGAAYDWELTVEHSGQLLLFSFSGRHQDDGSLVVVAGASPSDIELMYQELLRTNNEQANMLRSTIKELTRLKAGGGPTADEAVATFANFNNELLNLQRELARKNVQLERLDAQKNQLLGMVVHDLRNPLQVISGYTAYLLGCDHGSLSPDQRRCLVSIERASSSMLKNVEDLMDLSAIEAGQIRLTLAPMDLALLLMDVIASNQILANAKGIRIAHPELETIVLSADAHKLRQVFNNLLSNAVKFSHKDTVVQVSQEIVGDAVLIRVVDQGQGIPKEEQGRLFQPFMQTSVKATAGEKSMGLGLAIARRIVDAHSGSITVDSAAGEGATFSVTLPLRG